MRLLLLVAVAAMVGFATSGPVTTVRASRTAAHRAGVIPTKVMRTPTGKRFSSRGTRQPLIQSGKVAAAEEEAERTYTVRFASADEATHAAAALQHRDPHTRLLTRKKRGLTDVHATLSKDSVLFLRRNYNILDFHRDSSNNVRSIGSVSADSATSDLSGRDAAFLGQGVEMRLLETAALSATTTHRRGRNMFVNDESHRSLGSGHAGFPTQYVPALDALDNAALTRDFAFQSEYAGLDVTVAILATGLDTTHTEFGDRAINVFNYWGSVSEHGDMDANGVGTALASAVGGRGVGIARNVSLEGYKVLNDAGSGSYASVLAGLDAFAERHYLNVSEQYWQPTVLLLAFTASCTNGNCDTDELAAACNDLVDKYPTVIVSPAGDDGCDKCQVSPAASQGVISVGATNAAVQEPLESSNFGRCVDIYAPGAANPAACSASVCGGAGSEYTVFNGSAIAAAYTAGIAAQWMSHNASVAWHSGSDNNVVRHVLQCGAVLNHLSSLDTHSKNLVVQMPSSSSEFNCTQLYQGCADRCSEHGVCEIISSTCSCDKGYYGETCALNSSSSPACGPHTDAVSLVMTDPDANGWSGNVRMHRVSAEDRDGFTGASSSFAVGCGAQETVQVCGSNESSCTVFRGSEAGGLASNTQDTFHLYSEQCGESIELLLNGSLLLCVNAEGACNAVAEDDMYFYSFADSSTCTSHELAKSASSDDGWGPGARYAIMDAIADSPNELRRALKEKQRRLQQQQQMLHEELGSAEGSDGMTATTFASQLGLQLQQEPQQQAHVLGPILYHDDDAWAAPWTAHADSLVGSRESAMLDKLWRAEHGRRLARALSSMMEQSSGSAIVETLLLEIAENSTRTFSGSLSGAWDVDNLCMTDSCHHLAVYNVTAARNFTSVDEVTLDMKVDWEFCDYEGNHGGLWTFCLNSTANCTQSHAVLPSCTWPCFQSAEWWPSLTEAVAFAEKEILPTCTSLSYASESLQDCAEACAAACTEQDLQEVFALTNMSTSVNVTKWAYIRVTNNMTAHGEIAYTGAKVMAPIGAESAFAVNSAVSIPVMKSVVFEVPMIDPLQVKLQFQIDGSSTNIVYVAADLPSDTEVDTTVTHYFRNASAETSFVSTMFDLSETDLAPMLASMNESSHTVAIGGIDIVLDDDGASAIPSP